MRIPPWMIGLGIALAILATPGITILFTLLAVDFWWSVIR